MLTNNNCGNGTCNGVVRNNVSYEDFAKVFKVFGHAPFFEKWTPEMVRETYESFNAKDGEIFGYYVNDECAGIVTIHPMVKGEHPVSYPDNVKVMYLSDVATLPKFRKRGIGTILFDVAMRHSKVLGYDYMYLRTNERGKSMSYSIAEKCGFKQICDLCQEVEFDRTRDYISNKDLRIFMERKL